MDLLLVALMLILAVLASNFISKFLPSVATPLVQIALGACLSFVFHAPQDFELPTTLFMALFVAPLIYSDSKAIDRVTAWRSRRTILKLAIGLVIANTLLVGYVMGVVVLPLPLAAAFVLGAACSPTDPVSVSALAGNSDISGRQRTILSAESIVNDATGVVVFNIALAALVTGSFHAVDAGVSFLWLFFGGILIGFLVGVAGDLLSALARALGCDDVTFHVLLDVAMPFVTFLVGEVMGVSPIMAVMVCALVYKIGIGKAGPDESRINIVSNATWDVLSFVLNGIVFVMLGFQLKAGIADIMGTGIDAYSLAGAAVLLVALLAAIRFTWVTVMEFLTRRRLRRHLSRYGHEGDPTVVATASNKDVLHSAAVLTFAGGTKGAITLSIAFSIPYSVQSRSLVVFLVSVAIIATIVTANVLIPLLSPAPARSRDEEREAERLARIDVLRHVIGKLSAESDDSDDMATQLVIADYNLRIRNLKRGAGLGEESVVARREVRLHALRLEAQRCNELVDEGKATEHDGFRYLSRIDELMTALGQKGRMRWLVARNLRRARGSLRTAAGLMVERVENLLGIEWGEPSLGMRELQRLCAEHVVSVLSDEMLEGTYPIEDVTQVMMDYQRTVERLDSLNPSLTVLARRESQKVSIQIKGVNYELEGIQDAFEAGRVTRDMARRMRDDAYLMRLDLEKKV